MHSLTDHAALPVFLRQPAALQQQQVLCKLLCTSKSMAAAIKAECSGQATVANLMPTYPSHHAADILQARQQLDQFVEWLAKCAPLLKALQLDILPPLEQTVRRNSPQLIQTVSDRKGAAEAAIAAALQRATAGQQILQAQSPLPAAAGAPLPLQSFKLLHGRSSALCILQQLPQATLTSMHLQISKSNAHLKLRQRLRNQLPSIRSTAPVLAGFTALTALTVMCPEAHKLAPALPSLERLQQLSIAYLDVRCVGVLGQLSRQLRSLQLNVLEKYEAYYDEKDDSDAEQQQHQLSGDSSSAAAAAATGGQQASVQAELPNQQHQQPVLQLQSLASLQSLTSHTYRLQPHDQLPASLTILELGICSSTQPLLQLRQLQRLTLHKDAAGLAAADLALLKPRLQELRSIGLSYQRLESAAAAAPAWPSLPLASLELELDVGVLGGTLLQQLAACGQCLTRLCVSGGGEDSAVAVSPGEFGGVLQQLSRLQELELLSLKVAAPAVEAAVEAPGRRARRATAAAAPAAGVRAVASSSAAAAAAMADGAHSPAAAPPAAASNDMEGMSALVAAMAALPQLNSLTLSNVASSSREWLQPQDFAPLTAATQLTCLHIFMSWIDDAAVISLAGSLLQLRRLGLDHCARVTAEGAAAALQQLQQLTWLSVWGTRARGAVQLARPGLELVGP